MLQLFLLGFGLVIYFIVRNLWRNRDAYLRLIRLFSELGSSQKGYRDRQKRIAPCPHCGSTPEIGGEPCTRCGKIV